MGSVRLFICRAAYAFHHSWAIGSRRVEELSERAECFICSRELLRIKVGITSQPAVRVSARAGELLFLPQLFVTRSEVRGFLGEICTHANTIAQKQHSEWKGITEIQWNWCCDPAIKLMPCHMALGLLSCWKPSITLWPCTHPSLSFCSNLVHLNLSSSQTVSSKQTLQWC